jgi:5'-nucleotidase
MRILVTNDDGYQSIALQRLLHRLSPEHALFMVSPECEQSGVGQGMTMYKSLRCERITDYTFPAYWVSGTPSDCIKLAVCHLASVGDFDLVLSGVNPGENAGLNALYSGTVAAAREAATWGLPAIALSVWDHSEEKLEFAIDWIHHFLQENKVVQQKSGTFWNVNFPPCSPEGVQGTKVCPMSEVAFVDKYIQWKTPRGHSEYWIEGYKPPENFKQGEDDFFLQQGYVTVAPLQIGQTSQSEVKQLQSQYRWK